MINAKRASIWAVVMVLMVFLANLAGILVNKLVYANTLMPAMTGYSKKMEFPLKSDGTENGEKRIQALIMVRSVLSDTVITNDKANFLSYLVFTDLHIDQSVIFHGPEGMTDLSSGIFAPVYEDKGQKVYLLDTVGVLDVSEFSKFDCAKQLYEVLENNKNATVRLDSYSVRDYIIEPAKITVLDESGNEITSLDCPCTGDVQKYSNIVILNKYEDANDSNSLYVKLSTAYLGERSSDKKAKALSEKLDFSRGDYSEQKTHYGFGKLTSELEEVIEGRGAAMVFEYRFLKSVIIYSVIFCLIATLILIAVFRKHDRNNSYY